MVGESPPDGAGNSVSIAFADHRLIRRNLQGDFPLFPAVYGVGSEMASSQESANLPLLPLTGEFSAKGFIGRQPTQQVADLSFFHSLLNHQRLYFFL